MMGKSFLEEISKEVGITLTVDIPHLLDSAKVKKSVRVYVNDILDEIFKIVCQGLDEENMPEYDVFISSSTIFSLMDQVSQLVTESAFLTIWLFFGKTVERWIEVCVEYEEYESASNLKKILESDSE